ncbi:MAG: hypothetical protein LBD14_04480 [Puniceicoccales bacterium]|jgi:hypothetical protein|nr:hypothetical protein [Puniceicoccales bacterium]
MCFRRVTSLVVFIAVAGVSQAAPLREADVAPGAAWFAHVDFEKLGKSEAGRIFHETFPKFGGALERLRKEAGFDVREHLSGVTVYGSKREGRGAVVIRHGFSNEKLAVWLKPYLVAGPEKTGSHYALPVGRIMPAAPIKTVVATLPREGVAVLSVDEEGVTEAVARLGEGGSASEKELFALFATGTVEVTGGEKVTPKEFRAKAFIVAGANVRELAAGRGKELPGLDAMGRMQVFVSGEGGDVTVLLGVQIRSKEELAGIRELLHAFAIAQRPRFKGLVLKSGTAEGKDAVAGGPWLVVKVAMPARSLVAGLAAEREQLAGAVGGS